MMPAAAATTGRHTCACSTRSTKVIETELLAPSCPALGSGLKPPGAPALRRAHPRRRVGPDRPRPRPRRGNDMGFTNRPQERLARGELALCMPTRLARTAEIAMIAESCGFDAFYIDMEHCTISLDDAAQICLAALPVGITPLVRIAGHRFEDATRLLDMGALGIICPNVSSRAQAE